MSALGNSFTFKGIDFGGENYGVYVVGEDYPHLPRPRVSIDQYAQADGAATQGSTFEPRAIALECKLVAGAVENRQTQLDNVAAALATSQVGPGNLTIDLIPGKVFTNARLLSSLDSRMAARMETFSLEFIADAFPSATEETELEANNNAGGITSG